MVRHAAIGLIFCLLIGCKSSGPGQERSPGEVAFRANCQTCHRLPKPDSQTDADWPALVARYGERAKLSSEQVQLIAEYLQSVP